jgi:hypothetical protein
MVFAGSLVCTEVFWERMLELQSNALTHDANAIHSVHHGFRIGLENVASGEFNHEATSLGS